MAKPIAVCLLSGGLDSCVATAVAAKDYDLALLHVNYGQRTQARELKAFLDIADFYGVKRRLVTDVPALSQIGGSALTCKEIAIPEGQISSREIPITYVPFRNAHFLAIAVSWGELLGAKRIFIGASQVDFSGYPDCRASFFEAFNRVIEEGTKPETHIRIEAPLLHLTKAQIVKLGVELNAPLHLTWSCYQREDMACGRCESCLLRLKGFREAGLEDPIPYQVPHD